MDSDLIYDVGMHVGADTEFYLRKGFRVIAIEANPELTTHCQKRFRSEVETGQLTILNLAVSERVGTIELFLDDENDLWGTTDEACKERFRATGHSARRLTVASTTMNNILSEHKVPYYMKIDIEGSDNLCLEGLRGLPERPTYLSIEASATSFEETMAQLELLSALGYTKFKPILQNDVHKQSCPNPAREGLLIEHSFGAATSGLFGKELPGEWKSYQEIIDFYRKFYFKVRMIGVHMGLFRRVRNRFLRRVLGRIFHPGGGWYDTHATF